MAKITIDTGNLKNPKAMGYIISYYMYDADLYELSFYECPEVIQRYFYYLDTEERKSFKALCCKDSGVILGDWEGDRYVFDGKEGVGCPEHYDNGNWIFTDGQSLRFGLDLEKNLFGE